MYLIETTNRRNYFHDRQADTTDAEGGMPRPNRRFVEHYWHDNLSRQETTSTSTFYCQPLPNYQRTAEPLSLLPQ